MHRARVRLIATGLVLLAGGARIGAARADQLDKAQKGLDAATAAAERHQAAAAAAARTAATMRKKQEALVAQEIAANANLRAAEDRTAAIVARLAALQTRASKAKAELDADAAAIAPLLPLITRLSMHPATTLLAAEGTPGEAVTGVLAMQGITRMIGARARALQAARLRYATLSASLSRQQSDMMAAVARQQAGDAALQQAIVAANADLSRAATRQNAEARAAEAAASRAKDLAGVVARLQDRRKAEAAAARIVPGLPKSLGGAPVAGKLVRSFASATATGNATGDTFAAPPGAMVSATCSGRVVFARPFSSYGKLMILDCGGGYDFVMSGFERFDIAVGQHVEAGQPVGRMPQFDPHNPGNQPRLYVELRRDGKAIDPAGHFGMKSNGH